MELAINKFFLAETDPLHGKKCKDLLLTMEHVPELLLCVLSVGQQPLPVSVRHLELLVQRLISTSEKIVIKRSSQYLTQLKFGAPFGETIKLQNVVPLKNAPNNVKSSLTHTRRPW